MRARAATGQTLHAVALVQVLNMPDGWMGKKITQAERAASRFRARASSNEAQADAYTMLAILAEREGGPEAALPHLLKCSELASTDRQKAEAHDNLARVYKALDRDDEAAEQRGLAAAARKQSAAKEEEAARKKAEAAAADAVEGERDADGAAVEDASGDAGGPPSESMADEGGEGS